MHQALRIILTLSAAWLLTACAAPARPLSAPEQARLAALLPADALLVGEQHDAPEHQQLQRQIVDWLAARGDLAALAMEMAERPHTTAGLPRDASESAVRAALAWDEAGWPWATYGPVVMAAVRAGVPVRGANLPRADMRRAMADPTLDARLPPAMLAEQESRIREAHCHALPESQIRPHDAHPDRARRRHGANADRGGQPRQNRAAGGRQRACAARLGCAAALAGGF